MGSLLLWSQNASFLVPVLELSAVGCRGWGGWGGWVGVGNRHQPSPSADFVYNVTKPTIYLHLIFDIL